MHDLPLLRDLVILVAIAIPVVLVAHKLRVPTIVGFLLTGIALGPHGLGLLAESNDVSQLAEVGAVLLLFAVGLELSLSRVIGMGRDILIGGGAQVVGTIALVGGVTLLAGLPLPRAAFAGALIAFSSTAIILRLFQSRGELDTPHGRVVVAVAVFQDLAVVPVMILMPLLAGGAAGDAPPLRQIVMSLAVIGAIILVGRFVVPPVLDRIVRTQNREIFTLAVVFLGLAAAYAASQFGLSLALGAFLAGLVISESDYGLQALADVLPFRDAFSGIFFTSVGMLLDPMVFVERPLLLLGIATGIVAAKAVVAGLAVRLLGRPFETSVMSGVALAQVGEFSFVLAGSGAALGLLTPAHYQVFLAGSVTSMLAAPFLIAGSRPLAERLATLLGRPGLDLRTSEEMAVGALTDHVIVVGYGLNGRTVARALRSVKIPYVVLDQNGRAVREAREAGEPILFGDGTNAGVLEHVGVERARVVVFAIATPDDEKRGVAVARRLNAAVHIVVRTRYVNAIEDLEAAGANDVVPEEFETSLDIFAAVLVRYGVRAGKIRKLVQDARHHHYEVLRGRAVPTARMGEALTPANLGFEVETMDVEEGATAVGKNPVTMRFRSGTGAIVLAVVRGNDVIYEMAASDNFEPGDTVVVIGIKDALEKARAMFAA